LLEAPVEGGVVLADARSADPELNPVLKFFFLFPVLLQTIAKKSAWEPVPFHHFIILVILKGGLIKHNFR
jgi:hypothetical protein